MFTASPKNRTAAGGGGGGSLVFLSEIIASDASTVDFIGVFDSTYDVYKITCTDVVSDTDNDTLLGQAELLGGSFVAFAESQRIGGPSAPSPVWLKDSTATIASTLGVGSSISQQANFETTILAPRNRKTKFAYHKGGYRSGFNVSSIGAIDVTLNLNASTEITGLRYLLASGLLSGTFRLYGLKKS